MSDDDSDDGISPDYFGRNSAWITSGDHQYNTDLGDQEPAFRDWVSKNKVPFDVQAPVSDYDMRGFYKGLTEKDPQAVTAVNSNDGQIHFPDYWKTPYHESFSAESQWADPQKAPRWNEQDQLVLPNGSVIVDERQQRLDRIYQQYLKNMRLNQMMSISK